MIDFPTNLRGPFRNIHDEKLNLGPCDFCGEQNNSKKEITRVPCETCGRVVCWKCADCGVFSSLSDFQHFIHRRKALGKDVFLLAESCPNCQEMTWWKKYGSSRRKHATSRTQIERPQLKTRISLRKRIINFWRKAGNFARRIRYKRTIEFSHTSPLSPSELIQYFTEPDRLKEWLCDSAEYDPETANLILSYGQDHFVVWQILQLPEETIEIKQDWMGIYEIDIRVEFHPASDTTMVKVLLEGEISLEMEAEYRNDWKGLRHLP